ncbi:hypothetical protein [Enterovibrio nigricans]|uniref:Cytochrome oxidase Cu insertion factor, SCO1/SenC/PrrC family n=1 Tax=Enterovibrio nigricans DSM 22720 TaxID=1121868 RepID=A0A1T4UGZ3_9GAMM|nr:hypothetical protein [Enterovibrio nigricans]PKF51280.1 hypothetical protein AT251_05035 [Enterovibrio nigricans]SKA51870.1 hypothetical protein SAMN02745132_01705 [Enterovibrio nigricans DSM 22720]
MTGKKGILLVTIAFLLPVVAAKWVLEMGWYNKGVTNNGELLSGQTKTEWLEHQGLWRLIYTLPEKCTEQCESALFQLNQIPVAVGRERERVASILLVPSDRTEMESVRPQVTEQPIDAVQQKSLSSLPFAGEAIYLVDPLNNLILAYPIPQEKAAQITQSKGLLKDLRKLMKLSKVG